jgi:hypothetical protein
MPGAVNVKIAWSRAGGGATAPVITSPAFLVAGTVDTVYPTTTFTATGTAPITWSVTAGTLPAGMSFSSAGVLSGTPTATASASITFTATNALGADSRALTLTVSAAGVYGLKGPWARPSVSSTAYPAFQYEWDSTFSSKPLPATSGTRKVEVRRGGTLISSHTKISQVMAANNPASLQAGDEVWVYPAVYGGNQNAPVNDGDFCQFGGGTWTANNITVKGITEGGFRPVMTYQGGYPLYTADAVVVFNKSINCVFENIDIDLKSATWVQPAYLKSSVYFQSMLSGTATLKNCRLTNDHVQQVNGAFAGVGEWAGNITIENCEFFGNGGNAGPEHNVYLNYPVYADYLTSVVTVRGCFFSSVRTGNHFKSRTLNNIVEGNYFMGTQKYWGSAINGSSDSFLVELTGAGNATIKNNIFVKTYTDDPSVSAVGNLMAICAGVDRSAPPGDTPSHIDSFPGVNFVADVHNNTFVSYSSVVSNSQPALPYFFGSKNYNQADGFRGPIAGGGFWSNQTWNVRDNVYVGVQAYNNAALDFYRSDATSLLKTWADDAIHVPGANTGAAFALKSATASSSSVSGLQYNHQSSASTRSDTNKGARA